MYKVIVAGKIHTHGIDLLKEVNNFDVFVLPDATQETLEQNLEEADAILLRLQSFDKKMIDNCPKLKILSRNGVGFDRIDIPELTRRNIPLTIVGDVNSSSVAEHTIMFILNLLKNASIHDEMVRNNKWQDRDQLISNDFSGRELLIVGYGRIGQKVATLASAFGANISIYDPYYKNSAEKDNDYKFYETFDEALSNANIISLHAPGTEKPIIGEKELNLLQSDCIIVNTSRGSHIDLSALSDALSKNKIRAAGLDVFPNEPPETDVEKIFELNNLIFSPHIAGLNNECASRMAINSAQNIIDALNGSLKEKYVINKEVL
jgi:D-3-phosphoglycerate dehydrogenase